MELRIGMYLAVSDLSVSERFYSRLFETEPYISNENYIGFMVGGGLFGIMREDAYAYPMTRGNNVVPNFSVKDIDLAYEHVKSLDPETIQDHIKQVGSTRLFLFMDPDGNVIEYSSIPS